MGKIVIHRLGFTQMVKGEITFTLDSRKFCSSQLITCFRRFPSPNSLETCNTTEESETSLDDDSTDSNNQALKRLNCPLCIQTFGYSFGLECHLLSVHQDDLRKIRQGQLLLSQSCGCLCCAAQFLKLDTLVRHVLDTHKDFLISSMQGKDFSDFGQGSLSSSLKRHLECQFCGQKFLRRHQKMFLVHLEKCHIHVSTYTTFHF